MPPATSPNARSGKDEVERWPARLVGGRLREVRRGRGLTLDVAGSAGFTKSFVSAVERGETSPSIGWLHPICEVPAEPHSWRNPDGENPAVALFFEVPAEC